jgi:5-methylcytosine-specific restriction endonuclease McrA
VGNAQGAEKAAATRLGMTWEAYRERRAAGEKWCGSCRAWHRASAFTVDASRRDGLAATCGSSRRRGRPSRLEHEAQNAKGKFWCSRCHDWTGLASGRRCRMHVNEYAREHYAKTGGEGRKQRAAARRRGVGEIPGWWRAEQLVELSGACAYGCARPATTDDHVVAVAAGGESAPWNVVPACRPCNSSKKAGDPWRWVERGMVAFPQFWGDLIALALEADPRGALV